MGFALGIAIFCRLGLLLAWSNGLHAGFPSDMPYKPVNFRVFTKLDRGLVDWSGHRLPLTRSLHASASLLRDGLPQGDLWQVCDGECAGVVADGCLYASIPVSDTPEVSVLLAFMALRRPPSGRRVHHQ